MLQRALPAALLVLAMSASVLPAAAQAEPPPSGQVSDPSEVKAGEYAVDANHTQVLFAVSHMGFSTYYGQVSGVNGSLSLDPATPSRSKLSVSVPAMMLWTPSEKLTAELVSPAWLDAKAHPRITFESTSVTETSKGKATVVGDLTLHGVTKPVTLDVTFTGAGVNPMNKRYTVGFKAQGTLKRSEYGVKTYLPLIGDEVGLLLTGAFEQRD